MVLRFFLLAAIFFFISCGDIDRDNPEDQHSKNYTLTCANIPTTGMAGMAITAPTVTCNGATVSIGSLSWTGAPTWSNPAAGTYSGISVSSSGICRGKTATCNGTLTVVSKGNDIANYRTVRIGEQVWMAENLDYDVSGEKCYSNNPSNCATYGRLYDWATAMALPSSCNSSTCSSQVLSPHRGICPSGWHIPSDAEWNTLTNFVGTNAGAKLKATSGWNNNGNGTDAYGFAALPGGYGDSAGDFGSVGDSGRWWSASEYDASYAYGRDVDYYGYVYRDYYNVKSYLFSVRCIKD